ncbi:MAG: sensor histidine kinase [Glaciihabitans sp.]|nr:sensor histidine kinase [Glaciihabitans sp.]
MAVHIGTSGWSYDHWDGVLYPPGLPARDRLARYVEHFDTVELNASFYRGPPATTFASWRRRLPDGFTMSVKAPRGLTHAKKLYDPDAWVQRIEAGWHSLLERRAILLVQLPPTMERDDARLDYFLGRLPWWIRSTVEFRHPSWLHNDVFALLERHGSAYCVMSGAGLPCVLRTTADFVYVRLHGPDHNHLYGGSYSDADLAWWADRIREWESGGRDVFAYFNNDGGGNAVRNAQTLRGMLGV